jgi:hypothetical protein
LPKPITFSQHFHIFVIYENGVDVDYLALQEHQAWERYEMSAAKVPFHCENAKTLQNERISS